MFGELVVKHGKGLLQQQLEMQREIKLLANLDIGMARVRLGPFVALISGYDAAGRLLAKYPEIRLSLKVVGWREVFKSVLEEQADFGVGEIGDWADDPRFTTEALSPHCGRFFCRPDHPILSQGPRSLEQMAAYPWVGTRLPPRVASHFSAVNFPAGQVDPINGDFVPAIQINILMRLGSFLAGTNALVMGMLAMFEQELVAGALVPVPGVTLPSAYGFGYLKARTLSPLALAYMDEVRAVEAEFMRREERLAARFC